MYSRLSTILLVLGLLITFQYLAYTEAINDKWYLGRKTGKKSLGNKLEAKDEEAGRAGLYIGQSLCRDPEAFECESEG